MQRRPQYLNMLLPAHGEETATGSAAARRRLWWLIVGLTLLSLFLLSTGLGGGFK
jgi:hypothetical protein